jgi:hypothetical protein
MKVNGQDYPIYYIYCGKLKKNCPNHQPDNALEPQKILGFSAETEAIFTCTWDHHKLHEAPQSGRRRALRLEAVTPYPTKHRKTMKNSSPYNHVLIIR